VKIMTAADDFIGSYGPTWRRGILAEHADAFEAAGGIIRLSSTGSGRQWAVLPDGEALPLVCGDYVSISTEDGPIVGRCGADALAGDFGMCPGHAAEMHQWAEMTEAERAAWERAREYV
jgi:hypothetical protein